MRGIMTPRFFLFVWGGIGTLALVYVIIASGVKTDAGSPRRDAQSGVVTSNAALSVGEMSDFAFAFPPRTAPTAPFEHDGAMMTFADFKGKTVLVNFWATWCAPCLKELPSLDALQKDLGGDDFEVVAIAADPRGPEVADTFLKRLNITNLKLYADPRLQVAMSIGGASVLPVSILYDARGNEVGRLVGEADWSSPEARRLIESVIAR